MIWSLDNFLSAIQTRILSNNSYDNPDEIATNSSSYWSSKRNDLRSCQESTKFAICCDLDCRDHKGQPLFVV